LLGVARHVVELVRQADPEHVKAPALIDLREVVARFPLPTLALDLGMPEADDPPPRPRLHRVTPPTPEPELSPLERLMADPAVLGFGAAAVAEARDSWDKASYRGQRWPRPRAAV